jgi:hypothetical protein
MREREKGSGVISPLPLFPLSPVRTFCIVHGPWSVVRLTTHDELLTADA